MDTDYLSDCSEDPARSMDSEISEKEAIANAAYIVRAANSHEDMLAALKAARKCWGTLQDMVFDLIERGALTEEMIPDDYQALVVTLEAASIDADVKTEKAIAKAEGK